MATADDGQGRTGEKLRVAGDIDQQRRVGEVQQAFRIARIVKRQDRAGVGPIQPFQRVGGGRCAAGIGREQSGRAVGADDGSQVSQAMAQDLFGGAKSGQ